MSRYIGHISVPVYELGDRELTGLRQGMIEAGPHALSTGSGLGSDSIWAELETSEGRKQHEGRRIYRQITGRDVLRAVAELVKHPDADRFPATTDYAASRGSDE